MSTIEKAVKRLEELRRAGIVVPEPGAHTDSVRDRGQSESAGKSRLQEKRLGAQKMNQAVRPEAPPASRKSSRSVELDLGRLSAAGILVPNIERSKTSDEFRVVKRPLLDNVKGKSAAPVERANLIMVTSALPAEGKTFCALNLAMSIASEMDNTVLLVDADVPRPNIFDLLGLPPSKGLLDLLTEPDMEVSDALVRTNVPKLSLLSCGSKHGRATELLASQSMADLVSELANRYSDRVIIFDAPPLLPTTESRVLASHMGQIVVVVQANDTTHGTAQRALATIQSCPVVMTVLNMARQSEVGTYSGYYGYGHASGTPS